MKFFWFVYYSWLAWYFYCSWRSWKYNRLARQIYQNVNDHFDRLENILATKGPSTSLAEYRRTRSSIDNQMEAAAVYSQISRYWFKKAFQPWLKEPHYTLTSSEQEKTP